MAKINKVLGQISGLKQAIKKMHMDFKSETDNEVEELMQEIEDTIHELLIRIKRKKI